jgi:dTDP-glucose pyrophosphorylase
MFEIEKHIIFLNDTIIDALKKLNNVPDNLTLFVLNDKNRLAGTLTDGDIRRGFINGCSLDMPVSEFMSSNYRFIEEGKPDVFKIQEFKNQRIQLVPVVNKSGEIVRVYDFKFLKSVLPLECLIMAGGRGERLRPLTDTVPKPMLKIGNKPIIEHNIDRLISFGIEKIYISIKYLGSQIKEYFGDGSSKGISISYIEEDEPLGTCGALSFVKEFNSDYVLLMNGDLFTDIDFESFYTSVVEKDADMGIASIPYTINVPYAVFDHDNDSVLGFQEKPNYTKFANAGIYIFKKKWLSSIPKNKFFNITDLMDIMIREKATMIHHPIIGYWIDIGKMDDYFRAKEIAKYIKNE